MASYKLFEVFLAGNLPFSCRFLRFSLEELHKLHRCCLRKKSRLRFDFCLICCFSNQGWSCPTKPPQHHAIQTSVHTMPGGSLEPSLRRSGMEPQSQHNVPTPWLLGELKGERSTFRIKPREDLLREEETTGKKKPLSRAHRQDPQSAAHFLSNYNPTPLRVGSTL